MPNTTTPWDPVVEWYDVTGDSISAAVAPGTIVNSG